LEFTALLPKELCQLLAGLGMENAKIEIEISLKSQAWTCPIDEMENSILANKGAVPQRFEEKVAFRGEFSRVALLPI